MTKRRMSILVVLATVVLAFAGVAASTALPAEGAAMIMNTIAGNPAPSCPAPYVFSGKKSSCVPCPQGSKYDGPTKSCKPVPTTGQTCTTSTDANGVKTTICVNGTKATVAGKTASATALASGQITILADDTVKGGLKVVQIHSTRCHFDKTFKNSGEDANGHRYYFVDHNGTLCPSKTSPTGWVKVSGGMTGRHCLNPAADMNSKFKVIAGMVILVKSFAHIVVPVRASVAVYVQDTCGHAQASSLASATITLTEYAKAKGNVSIDTFGKTVLSLKTSVGASINCGPTVTTTLPGTTTTQTTTVTTTTASPPTTTVTTTTASPPTTTTTAPPAPKPQITVNVVQEVYASDTSDPNNPKIRQSRLCGAVKATPGHVLKVSFKAYYGKFDNPGVPDVTADGTWQLVCNTYTSPTEVGVKDHITIYATDSSVNPNTSDSQDSNNFDVVQAPANP